MVASTERVRAWFELAQSCMSEDSWKVATEIPDASLSHRSSPLGGHLVKFEFRNVFVNNAPANPSDLLVRPEVRGQYGHLAKNEAHISLLETLVPGEALLEHTSYKFWSLRLTSVLFGNFAGPFTNSFFYNLGPALTRVRLCREYPGPGDCTYACFQAMGGSWEDFMMISRNEGEREFFRIVLVFSTPEDKWAHWASPLFPTMTGLVQKGVKWFMNRVGVQEMRALNQKMYVALCLRNFHRGPPMFPHLSECGKPDVTISSGERLGLTYWSRWRNCSDGKFHLAKYLRCFLNWLGHNLQTHECLDGRQLVPYQCVLLRQDWEKVKDLVMDAFRLQKAAYRRANGGTSAPGILEVASPHFIGQALSHGELNRKSLPEGPRGPKMVIRNTFFEVYEGSPTECPSMRRSKSCSNSEMIF
ncbi:unnamed protein product [Durusdinium trenchii]|uniref:Uncharacterized protein n=1 Tax=Durusdinium trenchii TaxID=1381693 RepID=A0ABP0QU65_9DINO